LFCKNYIRKFRSLTAANGKKICNGNGNGVRKRQRLTATAERQWNDGNRALDWSKGRQPLGALLRSSNDPGELAQCVAMMTAT